MPKLFESFYKFLFSASVEKCLVCELLMDSLRTVLTDPNVDDDINKQLKLACRHNYDPLFETVRIKID